MSVNKQIAKNTVVTLQYHVTDAEGNVVDQGKEPLIYLHGGYDGIFPILEEKLQGKLVGDLVEVKLQPEDAFGEYDAELVLVEPRSLFPDDIKVGMQFERGGPLDDEDGEDEDEDDDDDDEDRLFSITDIVDDTVIIDGNHPLAGVAITFSCSIQDVRAATAVEITHGHVHGAGGHHH